MNKIWFVVVVVAVALATSGCNWVGCNNKEVAVTDRVVTNATLRVVDAATPVVVDKASKEVVAKAVPEVSERIFKTVTPEIIKAATPEVIKVAVPEVVKKAVPIAVPLVVKEAIPLVVAKAELECCPEKATQAPLKVTGVITGGGGTSASPNYRNTGSIGVMAPAPTQVVSAPVAVVCEPCSKKGGPRYLEVTPRLEGNEVVLPDFPCGTLVNVELYDDARGIPTRHLGAVHRFAIERGAGFNFTWRDQEGHVHYQMVTPQSGRLLVGTGLDVDCSHSGGCKYIRP